jgi:hypothetical protein
MWQGRHHIQIISGSLAASCFVAFTQIVSRGNGELPASLSYAVVFFSIAIPLLTACSLVPVSDAYLLKHKHFPILLTCIYLIAGAGIFCLFLSFGWLPAFAFLLSVAAVPSLISKY